MRITINFSPPLDDKIAAFRQLAATGIYEGLGRLANYVEYPLLYALREEAPVSDGRDPRKTPGQLQDSLRSRQSAHYGGGLTLEYRAIDYAEYVIRGTRPHEIYPHAPSGVLAFYGADGMLHYAKHVSHPGTQPNPFNVKGWESARDDVMDALKRTGRELLEQVA